MKLRKILFVSAALVGSLAILQPANAQELNEVPGHLMIDYGQNFLQGNPNQIDVAPFRSPSWNVSYLYPFRLDEGSKWSFNAGVGLMGNTYGFQEDVLPLYDTASINPTFGLIFDTVQNVLPAVGVGVSRLSATYVNLPLEVRWELSPDYRRRNLFVAVGGSIGYRIGANHRIRYTEGTGGETEDKVLVRRESFQMNPLRYGAHVRVGINFFNIYGRYEVSPLWATDEDGPSGSSWNVGISIDLF